MLNDVDTLHLFYPLICYSQGRPSTAALSSFEEVARSLAHVRAASAASSAAAAAVGQTLPGVDKDLGQEGFALKALFSSIHKNS